MSRRQHHGHGHGPRNSRQDGRGHRPAPRPFESPVEAEARTAQLDAPLAPVTTPPFVPPVATQPVAPIAWSGDRDAQPDTNAAPSAAPRPTNGHAPAEAGPNGEGPASGATAPQFRRFIKSRAYVPMHELRRRFGINGMEDDVTPVELDAGRVYVGLPPREGSLLGELLRGGEVGYELSLDPCTPVVIGVYPMRPVPRH